MKKDQELTALSDKTASLPSGASGSGGDDAEFEGVSTGLQRLSTKEDVNEAKDALIKSLTEELVETKAELARAIKERQYFQRKALWVTTEDQKILSPVISSTDNWYERTWLLLHEPIRDALLDFEDLVMNTPSFDPVKFPWKVKNFFFYFNNAFVPYVRRHHEAEEKVYIPWVASKVEVPSKISADHASMDHFIRDVEQSEVDYKALIKANTAAPERLYTWRSRLINRLSAMSESLRAHMDEEERTFPPIIHQNFSQKQEDAILEKMGHGGSAHYELPMIINALSVWGAPAIKEEFLNRLSMPARYTLKHYWMKTFNTNVQNCLDSLALEEAPPNSYVPLLSAPALVAASPVLLLCSIQ